jgi:GT2 family glycosyltransferase
MNHDPLISVVIPTYNRSAKVCAAVESALKQTYPNVEVIVIDDGSTDDTQRRLSAYGKRIRVEYQANAGPAAARNHGIRIAQGEFIAFLDSDDLLLPTFLERCLCLLTTAGEEVPCCIVNAVREFRSGKKTSSFQDARLWPRHVEGIWCNVPAVLFTRFVATGQTMVIRSAALAKTGGFYEDLRYFEDYGMALRLSFVGPWAFIREPLVVWRESTDSLSGEAPGRRLESRASMLRALEGTTPLVRSQSLPVRLLQKWALRRVRRGQVVDRMRSAGPVMLTIAGLVELSDCLWQRCFCRLPLYPAMKTMSLEEGR